MPDAEHEETAPDASRLLITKLTCSLVSQTQAIQIAPGTRAFQAYGSEAVEQFRCNYGLNSAYRDQLFGGALRIAGVGPQGEVRIVELSDHRFFVATLFLPQLASTREKPHPLIVAYLQAALAYRVSRPG
jgi:CTP synthase (UTP-ammonia lyase)